MRVNREELLKVLESVTPGLATREILEQSSCLVFDKGRVLTFNDSVACSRESPLKIQGAVKAKPLLDLLSRLKEDELGVEVSGGTLRIKGSGRRAELRMEQEVMLPIDTVEPPDDWRSLPAEFSEAVSIVSPCASSEESQFVLTCVHIHPEWLEACDRFQIARYTLKTGVQQSILVKSESLRKIVTFDMTEVCETESWIHFRNPAGLVLSCRRYLDDYKELDRFLTSEGTEKAALPASIEEIVQRAEVFSVDNAAGNHLVVDLREDRVSIQSEGTYGRYKEWKEKQGTYKGQPVRFSISPKLIVEVCKKTSEVRIGAGRVFVDGGKFLFSAVTETADRQSDKEED